ncbi:hypothetical protein QN277_024889 [Acacia crassicarpa]|uniref:Uncharacterized protein n=1 Tax=Acacia crassicarpa TaxID=499986 RepID=A0AAE1JET4_9FABA|nr:hypothetical protein QN277_024889 [Acacia crassicarpa]
MEMETSKETQSTKSKCSARQLLMVVVPCWLGFPRETMSPDTYLILSIAKVLQILIILGSRHSSSLCDESLCVSRDPLVSLHCWMKLACFQNQPIKHSQPSCFSISGPTQGWQKKSSQKLILPSLIMLERS